MMAVNDPRVFADAGDALQRERFELAARSIGSSSVSVAAECDEVLAAALAGDMSSGQGKRLAALIDSAPDASIARHVWRRLIDAWAIASRPDPDASIAATLFVVPVVIVAGAQTSDAQAMVDPVPGVLADVARVIAILREHGALGGCETIALSPSLVAADAIDVERLPSLLAWQRDALMAGVRDLAPGPIAWTPPHESVHLRFLVGIALAAPHASLLADASVSGWGIPLAQELAKQLAVKDVTVLALPRAPATPLAALHAGRAAQRAVGAQLFASNAIRRLRASVGEPSAVISAHRSPASPGGGELRLSLSSAFDPRQAEGFRCPIFPADAVDDVVTVLVDLLRDCRVGDVQVLAGVHPDRDAATGVPLLFKADAVNASHATSIH
ncbi:MAG: hypothetical protein ABI981_07750 [Betaproteobacteria bacterium]